MDKKKLEKLSSLLSARFTEYENARSVKELRWAEAIRQYLGKYDPHIEKELTSGRSKVYPRDTFVKVRGFVAKMMELMFPANEKNWGVAPSPVPNLREEVVNGIIDALTARLAQEEARSPSGTDIEQAVYAYAEDRARAMERECSDQLAEMRFVLMAWKVIRSGAIYGCGVAKGPLVREQTERIWRLNEGTGRYEAVKTARAKPYFEFIPMWNLYPDLDAKDWYSQEGVFERMIYSKSELYALIDEDEVYFADEVKEYLKEHATGNYMRRSFDGELDALRGTSPTAPRVGRMYEVIKYLGYWPVESLRGVDPTLTDEDIAEGRDILVEMWMLGGNVVRAHKAVLSERPSDFYHAFIFKDEEEMSMVGDGLTSAIRDSQLSHCAVRRMIMDNAAASAGPVREVNTDLIEPGDRNRALTITSFSTVRRKGFGAEAGYPAIRDLQAQSHLSELTALSQNIMERMDIESGLPAWMFGNAQALGEAFRTSSNMSMMMGGATMDLKQIVRAYDMFTESLIGALVKWNNEFNERDEIKGDFQPVTRGSTSLVAKELRGAALDQFMQTLTPQERKLLKVRETLIDRLQARDLPVDRVVDIETAERVLREMDEQEAAAMQQAAGVAEAEMDSAAAVAELNRARAGKLGADVMMSAIEQDRKDRQFEDQAEIETIDRAVDLAQRLGGVQ